MYPGHMYPGGLGILGVFLGLIWLLLVLGGLTAVIVIAVALSRAATAHISVAKSLERIANRMEQPPTPPVA